MINTGCYRELAAWHKSFKQEWRKLKTRYILLPMSDAYQPNTMKTVCTCPSFVTSHFLICKHLVQAVHHVPAVFFLEPLNQTLGPPGGADIAVAEAESNTNVYINSDNDDDNELIDTGHSGNQKTFVETMREYAQRMRDFADGLEYQIQFNDDRMLQTCEWEGALMLWLIEACLGKEKRLRARGGEQLSTWNRSTSTAMFWCARPACSDENS
ncbi:hypothetical protein BDQ17DRAFT_1238165 [Cyathus striatus]|nr:hypothetical protein BDQ17DRAFT_1238165 [Cyathus striatus]